MTSADLVEKIRRYPVPTFSGLVVFICLFAYYFRSDILTVLDARQNEVLGQRDLIDLNLVAGSTLREHMQEMRAKFAELESRVVQPAELAQNMNYFYQLESNTGVSLVELKQNAPSDKPVPKNQLGGVAYTISLSGTFPQVIGYFNELETGTRFYRLRSFNLQRGRETSQSSVSLTLNLELLGWQK